MSVNASGSLQPTWYGHVQTAKDALILFEACLNGTLHHVPRRPHDRERAQLIKSGCVFIYEENASGIKRWTDGVPWSPSRILGNFLVYRELMKPFPPGEKKRATKKTARPPRASKTVEPYPRSSNGSPPSPTRPTQTTPELTAEERDNERQLIGSLVDSYGFKHGGLVKKTMSVNVHGIHHHLVSYYTLEDAKDHNLQPPSADPRLTDISPRHDLIARQSFRAPLDEVEEADQFGLLPGPPSAYPYGQPMYSRPEILMGHQNAHAGMGLGYGQIPLTSSNYSPGMPSYATSAGVSQSYYAPVSTVPAVMKHEPYPAYSSNGYNNIQKPPNLTITTDRRASLPQQQQHQHQQYPYRGQGAPQTARPSLGSSLPQPHDGRAMDSHNWERSMPHANHSNMYTSTSTPQPHSAGPYTTQNSQWGMQGGVLPRLDGAWPPADGQWNLDHSVGSRHSSYQTAAQPNI